MRDHTPANPGALDRIRAAVGAGGWLDGAEAEALEKDERGIYRGRAALVVQPRSVAEIAAVVSICAAEEIPVVAQGGNTGLVGASGPFGPTPPVLITTRRLTAIRDIDAANHTMTVDAGCVLAQAQAAAETAGLLFPLSLGAEGSCTIGGNISTNAGGIQVLRYGTMRDLVLGLEAVLPDGTVWNGLRRLRKDNTGYDLKHLFIGAEGTLGIVTGAVLKLFPRPAGTATALVGLSSVEDAVALLGLARAATADALTAFELISRYAVEAGMAHVGIADPLASPHPWYTLMEIGAESADGGRQTLETLLGSAFEAGLVADGVVAASTAQARALWRVRESTWEGQRGEGASIKHDVSVPVSVVADFISEATLIAEAAIPGSRIFAFGHVGDGNIHFNLAQPRGMDPQRFLDRSAEVHDLVHAIVARFGGSISAEHGIGRLKRDELARYKNPVEFRMMRAVKTALDPLGLMNPGVLIPEIER